MNGTELGSAVLAAVLLLVAASPARADEPGEGSPDRPIDDRAAAALALFVEGRHLVTEGRHAEGCAVLEKSEALDPAPGTLVNLADCYEKSGRLATAWITFHRAAVDAQRSGRAGWAQQARERAAALEPRVPMLTLVVGEPPPGLALYRDASLMEPSTWGSPVPVDPGNYEVRAIAPSHEPWSARIALEPGARVKLLVPQLPALAQPTAPKQPASTASPTYPAARGRAWSFRRTMAVGAGITAVSALGLGGYLGVTAIDRNDEASARCPMSPRCTDPRAITLTEEARRAANGATVAFAIGGALLASSAFLWFAAPSDHVAIASNGASIVVLGSW